jgi:hypothetical protein
MKDMLNNHMMLGSVLEVAVGSLFRMSSVPEKVP